MNLLDDPKRKPDPPRPDKQDDTLDAVFGGRVFVWQGLHGYRCGVDPLLLAWFVDGHHAHVADLGCGVGVVGLLLLEQGKAGTVTGAEVQAAMAERALRSVAQNNQEARMSVAHGDLRDIAFLETLGTFDLVVANPPFYKLGSGRENPDEEVRFARHEHHGGIEAFCRAASHLLVSKGRFAVIVPAARLADWMLSLMQNGLRPVRLRPVRPRADLPANVILLEARKGTDEPLTCEPDLALYVPDGSETAEARALQGKE